MRAAANWDIVGHWVWALRTAELQNDKHLSGQPYRRREPVFRCDHTEGVGGHAMKDPSIKNTPLSVNMTTSPAVDTMRMMRKNCKDAKIFSGLAPGSPPTSDTRCRR